MKFHTPTVAPSDGLGNLPYRLASKIRAARYTHPDLKAPCWAWTAGRHPDGYGTAWWQGSTRYAHRLVYELLVGPIPEHLECDHLCGWRRCVNPAHIDLTYHRTNVIRGQSVPRFREHPSVENG